MDYMGGSHEAYRRTSAPEPCEWWFGKNCNDRMFRGHEIQVYTPYDHMYWYVFCFCLHLGGFWGQCWYMFDKCMDGTFSFFSPNHATHWRSKQFAQFRLKRTGGFADQGRNCFPMFRQWGCNIHWEYTILRDASSQISQQHAGFCSTFHIFKVLLTRNEKSTFEDGFKNTQQKIDLMFIHFFAA